MGKRLLIGTVAASLLIAPGANGALLKIGGLVLRADGGFTPRHLPRRSFAPISFTGFLDIRATDGGIPPPLRQVVIEFDRDGRLSTAGLPTCDPSQLQDATATEARETCGRAIVGSGHFEALIERQGGPPYDAKAPVTLFNGPPEGGHPTVIIQTQTTVPATQSLVITVPIERRPGRYRYRATIDVPPIDFGKGSLVHLDVRIGRRYRFGGRERSYVSARCSDNVLSTRGRFTFGGPEETVIEGSVEKGCTFR